MEVIISDRPFCNGCWVRHNDELEVIKKRQVSTHLQFCGQEYVRDEPTCGRPLWMSKDSFWSLASCPWTTLMDENGVILFPNTISCPLVHGSSRDIWLMGTLPMNWWHMSQPYSQEITSICLTEESATCLLFIRLCHFRCQGSLPINSWFPSLPLSFLKFPCSITLVLDPHLEVFRVHKFPSS